MSLQVHTLTLGPFGTNCHVLHDADLGEAVVADPGDEAELIVELLGNLGNPRVVAIWNTHGHIDHINANAPLQAHTGAPILIHEAEAHWLQSAVLNLAAVAGLPFVPSRAERTFRGGDVLTALGRQWTVHHVPGHSPGMCAIVCEAENLMVGGDLLMRGSMGRTDLPGGNHAAMEASLRGLFNDWGRDEWRVLSGHGPDTTIAYERRTNPFVREILGPAR